MKNNNKGFTLVELVSVLIVLILLFLLAVTRIRHSMVSSEMKATKATAISFVKGTDDLVAVNNSGLSTPIISGLLTYSQLKEMGLNLDGKRPSNGVAYVYDNKVVSACVQLDDYKVNYQRGKFKDPIKGECKAIEGYNKLTRTTSYDYEGQERTITLNTPGRYLIEAWGAKGGGIDDTYTGGYGAYAKTEFILDPGDQVTLYINVGGQGKDKCRQANCVGGYNGGSDTGSGTDANVYYGSGGGATSIALQSGTLASLSSNKDKVILVAAGGGGASYVNGSLGNSGGNGGGYVGGSSMFNSAAKLYYGTGATQRYGGESSFTSSTPGSFGKGGEFTEAINNVASSGAGGGYYGGGYAGGGGSSYFATSFTLPSNNYLVSTENSIMYCKNCLENSLLPTRTKLTSGVSKEALSGRLRDGNGFARVTKIEF